MGDLTTMNANEVSYIMHIAITTLPGRAATATSSAVAERHLVATSTSDHLIKLYDFNPSTGTLPSIVRLRLRLR
jgi:hypothetical protein